MSNDTYKTIERPSEGYFMDRKSKFYSFAFPVESQQQVKEILKQLHKKYYDARHIVYAYVLGPRQQIQQASDAGEPSGSSGPPVLRTILANDLTNVMIAVVRYFGGKKLGIPGLINAYSAAAQDALDNAKIIVRTITVPIEINCPYNKVGIVLNLLQNVSAKIQEQNFGIDCNIIAHVPISQVATLTNLLRQKNIRFELKKQPNE